MKKLKFLAILAILFTVSQTLKAQYLNGNILKPTAGDATHWFMYIGQDWANSFGGIMQNVSGPGHYGDGNDLTIWTHGDRDMVLNAGAGKLILNHLSGGGPVVIGTLNSEPGAKLTVAGKIACREVKVTATAGADFVFEKDYNLPKLLEVEKFVKENKHLPEVPTACEMETEGYDMGEFQVKLLQKIEELTLYTIEQQKVINSYNDKFNDMRKELDELKK